MSGSTGIDPLDELGDLLRGQLPGIPPSCCFWTSRLFAASERAKATPFGTTIAHGFLTLSLLTHLGKGTNYPKADPARYDGMLMGVNYGFDRVRFVSPVKVGSRIRAHAELSRAKLEGNAIQMTRTFTVEIEGEAKPALVAEWITRMVYA